MRARVFKVLSLISTGGPGGAERVFLDLLERLPSQNFDSIPVVAWEDWLTDELRFRGFSPVVDASKSRFDFGYISRLVRLVREQSIDIIHAHLFGPAVEASIVGLLTGVPVICTIHGRGDLLPNERLKWLKFALLNRGLARAVFVSGSLRDYFLEQGPLRPERTAVIPNGVTIGDTRTAAGTAMLPPPAQPGAFVVAAVGNLREVKRYDVLIRAAATLKERGDYQFVIAGQGEKSLLTRYQNLAAECGVADSVHFLGFVDDVDGLLEAADLFALTSDSEGFSIATVQAMAHGLPVVASRCGGPEEILEEGRTGLLFDTGAAEQLADLIASLHADPSRRRELGSAARVAARTRFSLEAQIASYQALYEEVIGAHHPANLKAQVSEVSPTVAAPR